MMHRYLPYLAGMGVALAWGLSFMFTRGALDEIAPFHLLGLRFLAAVGSMALLRIVGVIRIKMKPTDYLKLLPLSLFQPIIYFAAETYGVLLTSASYSGIIIAAIPIFVAILSTFILREIPNRVQALFILASVAGVVFIVFMDNRAVTGVNPLGTATLLVAVIAAACYNIASRKASVNYSPLQTTWVMMVIGAVTFNTISLGEHLLQGRVMEYFTLPGGIWLPIAYLGVFSSVVAFFMYNYLLSRVPATQASVFANMITVVAIAAGVTFRGEVVTLHQIIGTAVILLGVWGTNHFADAAQQSAAEDNTDRGHIRSVNEPRCGATPKK